MKTRNYLLKLLFITSILFFAYACSSATNSTPIGTPNPLVGTPIIDLESNNFNAIPTAQPGQAVISGILYSYTIDLFIPETFIFITPAIETESGWVVPPIITGANNENGDFITSSLANGEFIFIDVEPGIYYLFVWAPYNWVIGETDQYSQAPFQIVVSEDEVLNLGTVFLSWP